MEIEAGLLLSPHGVRERVRIKVGKSGGSLYAETVITPGFSDAHSHPQVVDSGRGLWRNSYEWIRERRLQVDEAAVRADIELSSKLAAAAMLRSLLDGVTLMAMVGRGDANVLAYKRLPVKPRIVVMPTVMDLRAGWPDAWGAMSLVMSISTLNGTIPLGFFVHSLGHTTPQSLKAAYFMARRLNAPFGLHLSEGVDELPFLVRLLGLREGEDSNVIAVHCIVGEGYHRYGIRVVHCPLSNMVLYGKTLRHPSMVDAIGSDWPLLLGSAFSSFHVAVKVHGREWARFLLSKATEGGYKLFRVSGVNSDYVIFDESLEKVIEGGCRPRFVVVRGEVVVREGVLEKLNLDKHDVDRLIVKLVREVAERYPA